MNLEKKIEKWSDEKMLENLYAMFQRATVSTRFIYDDNGILTHHAIVVSCGDKFFMSAPQPVEWPMIPLPPQEGSVH